MWRAVRTFLTPGWIAVHLGVWAAVTAMVLLGRWQLAVSDSKHFSLQNFSYVIQWWFFAACALAFWVRIMRDKVRPPEPARAGDGSLVLSNRARSPIGAVELVAPHGPDEEPVVYRGYRMPQNAETPFRSDADPVHGAYNDYLWQLSMAERAKQLDKSTAQPPKPRDNRVIEG